MLLNKDFNFNLTFNHDESGISPEDAVTYATDFNEGFKYSINNYSFKTVEFQSIFDELKTIYPEIKKYDFSKNKNNIEYKLISPEFKAYIAASSINMAATFLTKTNDDLLNVWNIIKNNTIDNNEIDIQLLTFSTHSGDLNENISYIEKEDISYISEKYYPYINTKVMFDQFFTGSENILLLVGPPGGGKSKMSALAIKHAYENIDKLPYDKTKNGIFDDQYITIGVVKSTDVLVMDLFWSELASNKPDIVILDDLDHMLSSRENELLTNEDYLRNTFLNHFLTFTDGVEKNNTKFIITTNQSYDDIDTAILRKGRLFDIIELRKLKLNEALDIWLDNNLKEDDFYNLFDSDDITPADLGSEINKQINSRIDNSNEKYILEDGISKLNRSNIKRRISL